VAPQVNFLDPPMPNIKSFKRGQNEIQFKLNYITDYELKLEIESTFSNLSSRKQLFNRRRQVSMSIVNDDRETFTQRLGTKHQYKVINSYNT